MKNFRLGFGVLVVLSLLLSGCDDTTIDPAKKKERYKAELVKVYQQMADVINEIEAMGRTQPKNAGDFRRTATEIRKFVTVFQGIDASQCPQDARRLIGELKKHFRTLVEYIDEVEAAFDEADAISKTPNPDQDRLRVLGARMIEISGKILGTLSTDLKKTGEELDEIARTYDIDPSTFHGKTSAQTEQKSTTSKPPPQRPTKPAPPRRSPSNDDVDVAAYMQPVYDRLFKRVEKLLELAGDANASIEDRKAAAEKVAEFTAHYRGSNFPNDFLSAFDDIERQSRTYVTILETLSRRGATDEQDRRVEKRCIEKFDELMKRLNDVAELYECTVNDIH